eukprot:74776-Hanusia_phi.AAC.1
MSGSDRTSSPPSRLHSSTCVLDVRLRMMQIMPARKLAPSPARPSFPTLPLTLRCRSDEQAGHGFKLQPAASHHRSGSLLNTERCPRSCSAAASRPVTRGPEQPQETSASYIPAVTARPLESHPQPVRPFVLSSFTSTNSFTTAPSSSSSYCQVAKVFSFSSTSDHHTNVIACHSSIALEQSSAWHWQASLLSAYLHSVVVPMKRFERVFASSPGLKVATVGRLPYVTPVNPEASPRDGD